MELDFMVNNIILKVLEHEDKYIETDHWAYYVLGTNN